MPTQTSIMLYKALVSPHFDYASCVWGSGSASQIDNLQDIQSKALENLLRHNNLEEKDLHTMAKTLTLEQRRNEQLLILMYNVYILKQECHLLEEPRTVNHGHNTRNNAALYIPKPNSNFLKKTVTYRGIQLWNSTIPLLAEFDSKFTLKRNCFA